MTSINGGTISTSFTYDQNGNQWVCLRIGFSEAFAEEKQLVIIPQIKEGKFGRKKSAVGDGVTKYVNVRFVHQRLLEECAIAD